ncbi:hypothetical protein [Arsenicibacter rosenii]|uniref:ZU5 domain-containing protein n=1 Tax=Arsenicibacter rosenii TaxID=1750698 RepID=A0A1S2VLX6_9BACT|nr:hypothetical protein [Arsenicibacter rosenii]OIN59762.1 hypothetical protein BLX24_07855 [Arsenicibacter rosenii]
MNKFSLLTLGALITAASLSCQKTTDVLNPDDPNTTPDTPAVTDVGTPSGELATATIGPAGGTILSADSTVRITIPAGALTTNQAVSVQELDKNNCPGGTGAAFRLLPHGLTFAKPATISFRYQDAETDGSAPELLRIAYQTNDRTWMATAHNSLDTTAHTIKVQTTHFSDWAMLQTAYIDPAQAAIDPSQSVDINAYADISENDKEVLLKGMDQIDSKYVDQWSIQGEGKLSKNLGTRITYTAPDRVPDVNPAIVSLRLKSGEKTITLKARIFIMPEGLIFRINKGPWIYTTSPLGLSRIQHGTGYFHMVQTGVTMQGLSATVSLNWPGNLKNRFNTSYILPWQLENSSNELQIPMITLSTNPKGQPLYTFYYEQNKALHPSPGNLTILYNGGSVGDKVYGTFYLKKAGIIEYSGGTDPMFDGVAEIEGKFRFKIAR